MSALRLSRERIESIETALCFPALLFLAKAVDSVFGVMCDPRIKVAGAPPFASTSIYGAPVWAAFLLGVAFVFLVIVATLPRLSLLLARYRLAVFIGFIALALVLPMLPFPHRVLGACLS